MAAVAELDDSDSPELHDAASFAELRFFLALRRVFEISGYSGFSWRDLHAPVPKRVQQQLSYLMNLFKFREDLLPLYEELNALVSITCRCRCFVFSRPMTLTILSYHPQRIPLITNLNDCMEENEQLNQELIRTERECHVHFQEMEEVIRECQELELEIARNNKLQAAARQEAAELKQQANVLKDELATATWALKEAEAEEENWRRQVVSSPNRRKKELAQKQEQLDVEKEECWEMEEQLQQCKVKASNLQKAIKDLQVASARLEELQTQAAKYKELTLALEETFEKIKANEKETTEIADYTLEAERTLLRTEEKIPHERKQFDLQIQATQEALDLAKTQLLAVEKERRSAMARLTASEDEVKSLEAALEAERANTQREIQSMLEVYKQAERALLKRNKKLLSYFQATQQ